MPGMISGRLRENFLHDVAVDVGEAKVPTLEASGEFGVIKAELMEDGGVEVVNCGLYPRWR